MARLMAVLVLAMMAGPAMSWGQVAQRDTVRAVKVIRVEHSRAGEDAKAGFGIGALSGFAGWLVWTTAQGENSNPFSPSRSTYEKHRDMRRAAAWSGICAAGGAILGAIIGSGERWTEEHQVGLVPLDGGAMLALSLSWP